MKKFLRALARLFTGIFTAKFRARLIAAIEGALPYLRIAYEFAGIAIAMTPTRTDDELLALAEALGVPALWAADEDRGIVIGRLILAALKRRFPDATDRILNRARELAYGILNP